MNNRKDFVNNFHLFFSENKIGTKVKMRKTTAQNLSFEREKRSALMAINAKQ